ncbi:MAG: DUF438 domain-containing protein [Clostridiaceae bacterium]|nr:DUF438 domain-containing protein [Clostridiaceae bacterium]
MNNNQNKDQNVVEKLKSYISRLSEGEELESVRSDFVDNFHSVEAADIALAEQEIISSGTPVSDVQKLCDLHSALFHGATREEQLIRAEQAVMDSLNQRKDNKQSDQMSAFEFSKITGHPINVFMSENLKISEYVEDVKTALKQKASLAVLKIRIANLRSVTIHYDRKGDLLYPLLNRTYGYSGPSDVMWGVDDEIRDELKELENLANQNPEDFSAFEERLNQVAIRAEEMVFKENNILFPLCLKEFSEEDWMLIYYEMPSYPTILSDGYPIWEAAENRRKDLKIIGGQSAADFDQEVEANDSISEYLILGSGKMKIEQIEAVLNTIPMELTFVDDQDINLYFDEGEKLFKRPDMAIGRDVYSCHPPKIAAMVKEIIESFRNGSKDDVQVWMEKNGEPAFVHYLAVRDSNKNYLGTLECVQHMGFAKEHFLSTSEK